MKIVACIIVGKEPKDLVMKCLRSVEILDQVYLVQNGGHNDVYNLKHDRFLHV